MPPKKYQQSKRKSINKFAETIIPIYCNLLSLNLEILIDSNVREPLNEIIPQI